MVKADVAGSLRSVVDSIQLIATGEVEAKVIGSGVGDAVSYTHLRAHETVLDLVCRLLLEKKKHKQKKTTHNEQ